MRIIFRVDSSIAIGSGHVSRCLNLADALRRQGAECVFVTRNLPGHLAAWIGERGYPCKLLRAPVPGEQVDVSSPHAHWLGVRIPVDATETLAEIDPAVDWLICDHYALDAVWHAAVRARARKILVIDDLADRPHDCDVLVDQNALPSLDRNYDALVPKDCRQLLGVDYALMSDIYAITRPCLPPRRGPIRRALIFFGSADSHDLTSRTLDALELLPDSKAQFDVVVPNSHHRRAEIDERAASMPHVSIHGPQKSLVPLIARADLAVGAGGVTMWERCALGLPSLVVTVADNQREGTQAAADVGVAALLGDHSDLAPHTIAAALQKALTAGADEQMSRRALSAVDALGARRVAAAILGSDQGPLRFRRASPADETRLLIWANEREARRHALQPAQIAFESHARWFDGKLRDVEACRIFLAETADGIPAGQVRFDRELDDWIISYALEPALRGNGLGEALLAGGIQALEQEFGPCRFRAFVKAQNSASVRVFEKACFRLISSKPGEALVFAREPAA